MGLVWTELIFMVDGSGLMGRVYLDIAGVGQVSSLCLV